MKYRIARCVCINESFEQLLSKARESHLDLCRLCEETGAGAKCELCRPYLEKCLETGETSFDHVVRQRPAASTHHSNPGAYAQP